MCSDPRRGKSASPGGMVRSIVGGEGKGPVSVAVCHWGLGRSPGSSATFPFLSLPQLAGSRDAQSGSRQSRAPQNRQRQNEARNSNSGTAIGGTQAGRHSFGEEPRPQGPSLQHRAILHQRHQRHGTGKRRAPPMSETVDSVALWPCVTMPFSAVVESTPPPPNFAVLETSACESSSGAGARGGGGGGAGHLGLTHTETQRGRLWTACGQRRVDSKHSQTTQPQRNNQHNLNTPTTGRH